ncbi:paraquat-inducible protein A [Paracoccus sp. Z118]|uniref:paraquat-inducible protein A n=1 Tax=Paracoccus sp. Z118 TaxID=2851017 RepID=UPI001C2CB2EA|nr:paraquat-inducible protein A [Paracoccus sp. Z118]MBV0891970.1 paraquat-inducible protein A [Paracoccus sp. Z118]
MLHEGHYDLTTGAGLLACPRCDALHVEEDLRAGETARCVRCRTVLARPHEGAFTQIVALSFTQVVLMVAAVFFPFLEISRMGIGNATSLFGVALAFSHGWLLPLTAAVVAFIVGLPVLRALLLIYVLAPMARGGRPAPRAASAFRMSEMLRPWSMAEIFVIGTAIALVKLGGLATVRMGPAFWAFCALILVGVASRVFTCSATIWDALEDGGARTDGREVVPAAPPQPADGPRG